MEHPHPHLHPSQASCRLLGRGRLISWEGSPQMKIDEGINTAVGQPPESFPLLKAAYFHSKGKKKTIACVTLW